MIKSTKGQGQVIIKTSTGKVRLGKWERRAKMLLLDYGVSRWRGFITINESVTPYQLKRHNHNIMSTSSFSLFCGGLTPPGLSFQITTLSSYVDSSSRSSKGHLRAIRWTLSAPQFEKFKKFWHTPILRIVFINRKLYLKPLNKRPLVT